VQRLVGFRAEDLAGSNYFDLLVEEDVAHVRALFADVAAAPDAVRRR